jgi:probable F420-dependent oxidoreductase
LKFGVNILNFGPGANPDALLRWAKLAETLGFDSVMICDHVAITPSVGQRYPEPFYDPFTTLSWLAGQTDRVRLGTTVVVLPYRHPVLMARMVANIDEFSGGRFIFGVGIGNAADEFEVLNQPHNRRGALADDCLGAMLALWNGEGAVDFEGRLINFQGVSSIRTKQLPHPPIWVGGNSPAAFSRTVRFGDAWHPILWRNVSIPYVEATALPEIRRLAKDEGREAPAFCPRMRLELTQDAVDGDREPGRGNLEQLSSDLSALQYLGAEHVTFDWYTGDLEATRDHAHGWSMLSTLADQVIDLDHGTLR